MKLHDAVEQLHLETWTAPLHPPLSSTVEGNVLWHTAAAAYPQETVEEPFVEDEGRHLQQGDGGQLDRVGLPQDGSDGDERGGRAHVCNNQTV